ncbi:arsenate reductase ArsC [Salidesulfovibrio brasiliensis]|uniref:arsenate reductase ArsC n=1 Tax=Salidesulfovibrio brasiliensis TaxID=221711 RepID=UPI0006D1DDA1|nr:arsenate reductase ArsC [Salidesulfovibrio brasiliensis]
MSKVLFICVHNSARSQMAEAFLNHYGQGRHVAESAGFEPTTINPAVVTVMAEKGIDISGNGTDSVFDFYKDGRLYSAVVTVCDEGDEAQCPVFPGVAFREHWPFPDPEGLKGTDEEMLAQLRDIRDAIEARVRAFVEVLDRQDAEA